MARPMKDSGIEWIGKIPEEWPCLKIKYVASLKGRIGWQGLKSTEFIDVGPFLVTGTDFLNGSIDWTNCVHITKERFDEAPEIHIFNDDLLITKDGTIGKLAIVKDCPKEATLNSGILLIRNTACYKYFTKFLYYVLLSYQFKLWYALSQNGNSTIKHLYQEQFYDFKFAYPSLEEQKEIAFLLDSKCQEIDNVLAKTRSSIEEYKKLKQAIITKAVTKGIHKNRKMKDSGIEWIGEIPEEWPLYISRFCIDYIGDVDHYMPESIDAGVPYIMTGDLKDKISKIDFKQCKQISFDDYKKLSNKIVVEKGDIILARYATIGTTCYVDIDSEFIVSYSCVIIKPDKTKLRGYYLFYYFKSLMFIEETIRLAKSNTQSNLGIEELYSFRIPLPDLTEQQIIIDYLDLKCSELDNLIKKKEQLISELESYKKSLIYEYVTGKKEVPMA